MLRPKFKRKIFFAVSLVVGLLACNSSEKQESATEEVSDAHKTQIEALESLGYLSGYREPESDVKDVTDKTNLMEPGYTLVTTGHAPSAYLLDQTGSVKHSWTKTFEELFPKANFTEWEKRKNQTHYWRHATLLPNGELLAIFEGVGIVKLDKDSKPIWALQNGAHHDLQLLPSGEILLLTRQVETRDKTAIMNEFVVWLDSNGKERRRVSLLDAVLKYPDRDKLLAKRKIRGDLLHANSVQLITPEIAVPSKNILAGDVLVSLRNPASLVIVRPSGNEIVWGYRDTFRRQHYARFASLAESGAAKSINLLVFDNAGAVDPKAKPKRRSRVLIYSWPSMRLARSITSLPGKEYFYTSVLGLAEPLGNGNILVVESAGGRIFELTPKNELAWSYSSPHRIGKDNQKVATIPHATRIPQALTNGWLK